MRGIRTEGALREGRERGASALGGTATVPALLEGAIFRLHKGHPPEKVSVSPVQIFRFLQVRQAVLRCATADPLRLFHPQLVGMGIELVVDRDGEVVDGSAHVVRNIGRAEQGLLLVFGEYWVFLGVDVEYVCPVHEDGEEGEPHLLHVGGLLELVHHVDADLAGEGLQLYVVLEGA